MLFAQAGLSMMDLSKALVSSMVNVRVSAIGAGRYQSSFTSRVPTLQLGLGLWLWVRRGIVVLTILGFIVRVSILLPQVVYKYEKISLTLVLEGNIYC